MKQFSQMMFRYLMFLKIMLLVDGCIISKQIGDKATADVVRRSTTTLTPLTDKPIVTIPSEIETLIDKRAFWDVVCPCPMAKLADDECSASTADMPLNWSCAFAADTTQECSCEITKLNTAKCRQSIDAIEHFPCDKRRELRRGHVKLTGGESYYGVVEVFDEKKNQWGTICADWFSLSAYQLRVQPTLDYLCYLARQTAGTGLYGTVAAPPTGIMLTAATTNTVFLDGLMCDGEYGNARCSFPHFGQSKCLFSESLVIVCGRTRGDRPLSTLNWFGCIDPSTCKRTCRPGKLATTANPCYLGEFREIEATETPFGRNRSACELGIIDYPVGTNSYVSQSSYVWIIKTCSKARISITISYFDLEEGIDYLEIYDGINALTKILELTGASNDTNPKVSSIRPAVTIKFLSDVSVVANGFVLSYTTDFVSDPPTTTEQPGSNLPWMIYCPCSPAGGRIEASCPNDIVYDCTHTSNSDFQSCPCSLSADDYYANEPCTGTYRCGYNVNRFEVGQVRLYRNVSSNSATFGLLEIRRPDNTWGPVCANYLTNGTEQETAAVLCHYANRTATSPTLWQYGSNLNQPSNKQMTSIPTYNQVALGGFVCQGSVANSVCKRSNWGQRLCNEAFYMVLQCSDPDVVISTTTPRTTPTTTTPIPTTLHWYRCIDLSTCASQCRQAEVASVNPCLPGEELEITAVIGSVFGSNQQSCENRLIRYPLIEGENYGTFENQFGTVNTCSTQAIQFNLLRVATEYFYDKLILYDGLTAASPLLAVLMGQMNFNPGVAVKTDGSVAFYRFTSDLSIQYDGFEISYQFAEKKQRRNVVCSCQQAQALVGNINPAIASCYTDGTFDSIECAYGAQRPSCRAPCFISSWTFDIQCINNARTFTCDYTYDFPTATETRITGGETDDYGFLQFKNSNSNFGYACDSTESLTFENSALTAQILCSLIGKTFGGAQLRKYGEISYVGLTLPDTSSISLGHVACNGTTSSYTCERSPWGEFINGKCEQNDWLVLFCKEVPTTTSTTTSTTRTGTSTTTSTTTTTPTTTTSTTTTTTTPTRFWFRCFNLDSCESQCVSAVTDSNPCLAQGLNVEAASATGGSLFGTIQQNCLDRLIKYPLMDGAQYPANSTNTTLGFIFACPAESIELKLIQSDLQFMNDYLNIVTGDYAFKITGNISQSSSISPIRASIVTLKFSSDSSVQGTGFKLSYSFTSNAQRHNVLCSCSATEALSSPQSPVQKFCGNGRNYENIDCSYNPTPSIFPTCLSPCYVAESTFQNLCVLGGATTFLCDFTYDFPKSTDFRLFGSQTNDYGFLQFRDSAGRYGYFCDSLGTLTPARLNLTAQILCSIAGMSFDRATIKNYSEVFQLGIPLTASFPPSISLGLFYCDGTLSSYVCNRAPWGQYDSTSCSVQSFAVLFCSEPSTSTTTVTPTPPQQAWFRCLNMTSCEAQCLEASALDPDPCPLGTEPEVWSKYGSPFGTSEQNCLDRTVRYPLESNAKYLPNESEQLLTFKTCPGEMAEIQLISHDFEYEWDSFLIFESGFDDELVAIFSGSFSNQSNMIAPVKVSSPYAVLLTDSSIQATGFTLTYNRVPEVPRQNIKCLCSNETEFLFRQLCSIEFANFDCSYNSTLSTCQSPCYIASAHLEECGDGGTLFTCDYAYGLLTAADIQLYGGSTSDYGFLQFDNGTGQFGYVCDSANALDSGQERKILLAEIACSLLGHGFTAVALKKYREVSDLMETLNTSLTFEVSLGLFYCDGFISDYSCNRSPFGQYDPNGCQLSDTLVVFCSACTQVCYNGVCNEVTGLCDCNPGWEKPQGSEECTVSICTPSCVNGQCNKLHACVCDNGWLGPACDAPDCGLGCAVGTCVSPYSCSCSIGWTGTNSSTSTLGCNIPSCNPECINGVCNLGTLECVCDEGWYGPLCDVAGLWFRCINRITCESVCTAGSPYEDPECPGGANVLVESFGYSTSLFGTNRQYCEDRYVKYPQGDSSVEYDPDLSVIFGQIRTCILKTAEITIQSMNIEPGYDMFRIINNLDELARFSGNLTQGNQISSLKTSGPFLFFNSDSTIQGTGVAFTYSLVDFVYRMDVVCSCSIFSELHPDFLYYDDTTHYFACMNHTEFDIIDCTYNGYSCLTPCYVTSTNFYDNCVDAGNPIFRCDFTYDFPQTSDFRIFGGDDGYGFLEFTDGTGSYGGVCDSTNSLTPERSNLTAQVFCQLAGQSYIGAVLIKYADAVEPLSEPSSFVPYLGILFCEGDLDRYMCSRSPWRHYVTANCDLQKSLVISCG